MYPIGSTGPTRLNPVPARPAECSPSANARASEGRSKGPNLISSRLSDDLLVFGVAKFLLTPEIECLPALSHRFRQGQVLSKLLRLLVSSRFPELTRSKALPSEDASVALLLRWLRCLTDGYPYLAAATAGLTDLYKLLSPRLREVLVDYFSVQWPSYYFERIGRLQPDEFVVTIMRDLLHLRSGCACHVHVSERNRAIHAILHGLLAVERIGTIHLILDLSCHNGHRPFAENQAETMMCAIESIPTLKLAKTLLKDWPDLATHQHMLETAFVGVGLCLQKDLVEASELLAFWRQHLKPRQSDVNFFAGEELCESASTGHFSGLLFWLDRKDIHISDSRVFDAIRWSAQSGSSTCLAEILERAYARVQQQQKLQQSSTEQKTSSHSEQQLQQSSSLCDPSLEDLVEQDYSGHSTCLSDTDSDSLPDLEDVATETGESKQEVRLSEGLKFRDRLRALEHLSIGLPGTIPPPPESSSSQSTESKRDTGTAVQAQAQLQQQRQQQQQKQLQQQQNTTTQLGAIGSLGGIPVIRLGPKRFIGYIPHTATALSLSDSKDTGMPALPKPRLPEVDLWDEYCKSLITALKHAASLKADKPSSSNNNNNNNSSNSKQQCLSILLPYCLSAVTKHLEYTPALIEAFQTNNLIGSILLLTHGAMFENTMQLKRALTHATKFDNVALFLVGMNAHKLAQLTGTGFTGKELTETLQHICKKGSMNSPFASHDATTCPLCSLRVCNTSSEYQQSEDKRKAILLPSIPEQLQQKQQTPVFRKPSSIHPTISIDNVLPSLITAAIEASTVNVIILALDEAERLWNPTANDQKTAHRSLETKACTQHQQCEQQQRHQTSNQQQASAKETVVTRNINTWIFEAYKHSAFPVLDLLLTRYEHLYPHFEAALRKAIRDMDDQDVQHKLGCQDGGSVPMQGFLTLLRIMQLPRLPRLPNLNDILAIATAAERQLPAESNLRTQLVQRYMYHHQQHCLATTEQMKTMSNTAGIPSGNSVDPETLMQALQPALGFKCSTAHTR